MSPIERKQLERSNEIVEIIGWLNGFASTVWLLPIDRVSDEYPDMYEKKVARLRELVIGGAYGDGSGSR